MAFPDLNSYRIKEPYIDTATFLSASLTFCAMKGGPMFDQFGIGCLLAAAANSLSISVISKLLHINAKTSYVVKICAVVSALTFSSLALPYVVMSLAAKTTIFLNYEVGIVFAIAHLVAKISFYILYRIACAITRHYSVQPTPKVGIKILPEFMRNIFKKFHEIKISSLKSSFSMARTRVIDGFKGLGHTASNLNCEKIGLIAVSIFSLTAFFTWYWGYSPWQQTLPSLTKNCLAKKIFPPLNVPGICSQIDQPQIVSVLQNNSGKKEVLELVCPANYLNQTQVFQNIFPRQEVVEFTPIQINNITPIATKNLTRVFFPVVTILSAISGVILYGFRARNEIGSLKGIKNLLSTSTSKGREYL